MRTVVYTAVSDKPQQKSAYNHSALFPLYIARQIQAPCFYLSSGAPLPVSFFDAD
jgi:hypothetical protein